MKKSTILKVWQIIALTIITLFLIFYLLDSVFAFNLTLNTAQEHNLTTIEVNQNCNSEVINYLKNANFEMQAEIEEKNKEIEELEGYKLAGQIAVAFAIICLCWSTYLIYSKKK